jgi:hypothetical protein
MLYPMLSKFTSIMNLLRQWKLPLESGTLNQIREELWELHDKKTCDLVIASRNGKTSPISFDTYLKKHGL